MKLILEKTEILEVLGQHFDVQLNEESVIIRTDPVFEIEVSGLRLNASSKKKERVHTPPPQREGDGEEGVVTDIDAVDESGGRDSVAAVLAKAKEIESTLERNVPKSERRAGVYSLAPPEDESYKEEI